MPDNAVEAARWVALWFEAGTDGLGPVQSWTPSEDATTALTPLERWSRQDVDLPETYPTGV